MKRLINRGLSALMAAVMLVTVIASAPFTVSADDSEPEFVFEKSINHSNGSQMIKLVRYNGNSENVDIPERVPDDYPDETISGLDYAIIREFTFNEKTNIKSVTIHDNINHIGEGAFSRCSNLEEVTIGTNLDYLAAYCFSDCPALSKVTIYSKPSSFTLVDNAFYNSPNVTVYGHHGSKVESAMKDKNVRFIGLDHSYDGDPAWTWDGYSSATAAFSCTYGDVTQEFPATVTSEVIKEMTAEENGEIKHTATVTFEGNTYSDTITQIITPSYQHFAASVTNGGTTEKYLTLSTAASPENWVAGSTLTLLADADITATVTVPEGAHTLDLNGFGIRAIGDQSYSVISVPSNAALTLNDSGTATHKYTVENSLATVDDSIADEGAATFTGGYITGGKGNNQSGGGIFNSGTFTMNAGTIIGNKVNAKGGGIFNSGTVSIIGGQIIYNVAQQWGGGIYMSDAAANTVNLSGGAVTNNLSNNNGGGIQVSKNSRVNLSGDPVVKDNFVTNGSKNDVNLSDNGIISVVDPLESSASIGIRMSTVSGTGIFTDSQNTDYNTAGNFFSVYSDFVVGKDASSGQLKLHTPYTVTWKNENGDVLETDTDLAEGEIPAYNGDTPVKPNDDQGLYVFDKWSPDVTAASGNVEYTAAYTQISPVAKVNDTPYGTLAKAVANWTEGSTLTLLADAEITATITVPNGAHTLDLNGFGIRATSGAGYSVITVPQGAELTLNDSGNTVVHKYTVENSLATVDDSLEGENILTFTGGYITGGSDGGVINYGEFTLNGGTIIGNTTRDSGGGIGNVGTANIAGGQIIYNVAGKWGGGIYMPGNGATVNLSGGAITHNLCNNNGGGIQVSKNCTVNISGAPVVKDNYVTNGSINNINLSDNGIIAVTGQLDAAASIGVRKSSGTGVFTVSENTDLNTADNFSSDNTSFVVGKDMASGQLKLHTPYTITWVDYNGNVLETDTDVAEGEVPVYNGARPVRPDDEASYYVFDKWSPDITAATADATYTATYTKYDAVAKVGDTLYLSFPEAVEAANGADIILLADINEPYTLEDDQTIRVIHGDHLLSVIAPEGAYRVKSSIEGNVTVYHTVKLYAEVDGTKYESFAEAVNATNGKKTITLLRDMDGAYSMNDLSDFDILRVKSNGFEANVTDYARTENKKGVTYYYKTDKEAYVDGKGEDLVNGALIIGTGVAVVVELGAGGGAGVTVVVGAGSEVLIDGGSEADFEPEDPDEECLEEEEQEDGSKKIKNLKYHWVKIDTGISILDAGAEVMPDCINDIWATYNQNTSSLIKITPPVLTVVGYTDVRLAFPYPDGWFFPPIPYLPESMNPGSHFVAFFENASFDNYGTPFVGKFITEDLDISGLWVPYEAAVVKPDGSLDYYLTFKEAAENSNGNIVQILSAPTLSYTLKKTSDDPLVYEVLKVKRGNYIGSSHVDSPSGVPDGYGMRSWTYTDEAGEVVTCYTIDGAFTATFVYNNGAPDTTQTVYSNQLVEKPEDPAKPRSYFEGWYADEQLSQPFDFTQPVYGNVTLYAKWTDTPGYSVQKVWNTGSNLSLRPDSVKAVLQEYKTGDNAAWQTVETVTLSAENNWEAAFNMPTDNEKQFRIRELDADNNIVYVQGDEEYQEPGGVSYTVSLDGYDYPLTYSVSCADNQNGTTVITNTLAGKTIQIEKKWDIDLENKDHPDSVQMIVQAKNGLSWTNVQLVTLSTYNNWAASVNVPGSRTQSGSTETIQYRVRELAEESLYSRFMSSIKSLVNGGSSTYSQWTAKLKNEGVDVYNALPEDIRSSIDQGYESLCRTLGISVAAANKLYDTLMNVLGLGSASSRVVYDKYDIDYIIGSATVANRVTYNVSGYSSALTGGEVENHATTYKVTYEVSGDKTTVTNMAIQIVDMFKHWVPLGVEEEDMPDSAWLVLMSKLDASSFEDAKSMANNAGFDISGLSDMELPVIDPLEGGSGPFNVLSEIILNIDLSWVDTALGLPKIGIVKVDEDDGWKKTIIDKKYNCGIPKSYRAAELSGEILHQIIRYLTGGKVDIPVSYNPFSNYVTVSTKAYPELRWMSLDDFDLTEVIAKGKTITQEDLDNFKPADLIFDKSRLMAHVINVKFASEPGEPTDIEYPDSNVLNGSKIWDGDEANRPEWLKIHIKEGDNEIAGSPITLYKKDFAGSNLWTWQITLDESVNKKLLTVTEEYPSDFENQYSYTPTVLGAMIANKWDPDKVVTGSYKFSHIDRYGDKRTKTVEVTLNKQEIKGYSGNNFEPGVATFLWTAEAQELFDKNPLLKASLAVTGNEDDAQKDVSVYKNDVEWDLIKFSADDANNMTPDPEDHSLTVLAQTKPYTFTFNYYFVKNGNAEYRGTRMNIPYGKPVTFSPEFTDPEKYEHIDDEIQKEDFCYWSADEAGLIPITTNRTFGMLLRGKWDKESETDRVVNVYAQYNNNLKDDWMPLIEEATFTHMIEDDNDWVYLDYMTNYLSKVGTVVQDLVAQGDQNIRYGLIAVKHPIGSEISREEMIALTQSMIGSDSSAIYTDATRQSVAYRFEYGKPGDTAKPITNFNRVLYTLSSDTDKVVNKQFSVIAYITVDGTNYFYSNVNSDINVHELLSE